MTTSMLFPHLSIEELVARAQVACATTAVLEAWRTCVREEMPLGPAGIVDRAWMRLQDRPQAVEFMDAWKAAQPVIGSDYKTMLVVIVAANGYVEWFDERHQFFCSGRRGRLY